MHTRGSGVLLHISSLPSEYGIGDLGPKAYAFADVLSSAQQHYWQVLPLNPTSAINGNSPYSSVSAFAGNPMLVSPRLLIEEGILAEEDTHALRELPKERVDYDAVYRLKERMLTQALERFSAKGDEKEFDDFCRINAYWLDDYALFLVLKQRFGNACWFQWPAEFRDREQAALARARREAHQQIRRVKFFQYMFFRQWIALKTYCNRNGIALIGDIPIYVTYDSVDVWTHPRIFKLNEDKTLSFLAGVPPDYFSATGQLWGNPVYNWEVLKKSNYDWWMQRIEHNMAFFDCVRIDHFRGFVDFWQVPQGESTAINGAWVKAPARDFFAALQKRFPGLPLIAEDLGIITDEVREVMRHFGFPGMKIILFAFGEDKPDHPYLPVNYEKNCVAYTGTHDNNTIKGWFVQETSEKDRERLFACIGEKVPLEHLHEELIRLVVASVADIAIIPLQDILGLDASHRMNIPGTAQHNWQWRAQEYMISSVPFEFLKSLTVRHSRA